MLGFPSNQFGNQEPGTNEEIDEFASLNYDVNFPMFAKIDVNGDGAAELYNQLRAEQPGEGDSSDVAWNFEKILVNPQGHAVARWGTRTTPEDIAAQLPDLMS